MIIGLLAPKGGVGRSTLGKALAKTFAAPIYEFDPGYPKLWPEEETEKEEVFWRISRFDRKKCDLCGECISSCQFEALEKAGEAIRHRGLCHGCGLCKEICPQKAITLKELKVAELVKGKTQGVGVISARFVRRAFLDGVVIKKMKEKFPLPERAILKAPCGLHGEALRTVKEAYGLLLVTKPGPHNAEEIKLFGEIVQGIGVPGAVLMNMAEEAQEMDSLCSSYGLTYLGTVPYFSPFKGDLLAAWPEGEKVFNRLRELVEAGGIS